MAGTHFGSTACDGRFSFDVPFRKQLHNDHCSSLETTLLAELLWLSCLQKHGQIAIQRFYTEHNANGPQAVYWTLTPSQQLDHTGNNSPPS